MSEEQQQVIMEEPKPCERPRTLQRMIRDIRESLHFDRIIKTAADYGWFTNGILLTKLIKEEEKFFRTLDKRQKNHCWPMTVNKFLRTSYGPELKFDGCLSRRLVPARPSLVRLVTRFNDVMYVPTWVYATLTERHPKCAWHLVGWNNVEEDPIVLIYNKGVYGMAMPFNIV